jgi:hypothetical protein
MEEIQNTDTQDNKYLKLFLYFIILFSYISTLVVLILASSFGNINTITNIILLIITSLSFGTLYKHIKNKYNTDFEKQLKSSIFSTSIILVLITPIIISLQTLYKVTSQLRTPELESFIGNYNINIYMYIIILILSFNFKFLIMLYKEKEYKKFLLYIIPIIISIITIYLTKMFLEKSVFVSI